MSCFRIYLLSNFNPVAWLGFEMYVKNGMGRIMLYYPNLFNFGLNFSIWILIFLIFLRLDSISYLFVFFRMGVKTSSFDCVSWKSAPGGEGSPESSGNPKKSSLVRAFWISSPNFVYIILLCWSTILRLK